MQNFIKKVIINTTKYSLSGLKATWKTERAFKLEIFLGIIGSIFIIFTKQSNLTKILLANSIFLVLIIELLNTALEKTIDKISVEQHPISKIVKDVASAAVFVALTNLILTWGIIFMG